MDLVDRTHRVWLLLHRAYRRLHEEGVITRQELEQAMEVLNRLDELSPEEIRRRLAGLGRDRAAEPPPGGTSV